MTDKRQPQVGDIWRNDSGDMFVYAVDDKYASYVWDSTTADEKGELEYDSFLLSAWHTDGTVFVKNVFAPDDDYQRAFPDGYAELQKDKAALIAKATPTSDPIHHPSHYNSHPSGIECIKIAKHHSFCIGSVIKYIWRAGLKDGNSALQDLKKARRFLDEEIETLERMGA